MYEYIEKKNAKIKRLDKKLRGIRTIINKLMIECEREKLPGQWLTKEQLDKLWKLSRKK